MIFYFSATGNSRYVADEIRLPDEEIISIETAVKEGNYAFSLKDERIGIITPTYDFALPSIVDDFLHRFAITFSGKPYVFYVGTFGTTTGGASRIVSTLMKKKGLPLTATFDIRMPDTWTVLFDLSDEKKVKEKLYRADQEIAELKEQLAQKIAGRHLSMHFPEFYGKIGKKLYDSKVRKTRNLHVSDACIGCGLCAKKCPVNAIEIKERKPVWVKEDCVMCLGCLHRCPKHAIYYGNGKATDAHGQYTYQKYAKNKD